MDRVVLLSTLVFAAARASPVARDVANQTMAYSFVDVSPLLHPQSVLTDVSR